MANDNLKDILEANARMLGLANFMATLTPEGIYQISFTHDGVNKQGVVDPSKLPDSATNVQKHEFAASELVRLIAG